MADILVEVALGDHECRQSKEHHYKTEVEPFFEDADLDLLAIAPDRLTLEVHLVEGFIDAFLACVAQPSQSGLAKHCLERNEDPEAVKRGLFHPLVDLLGGQADSNRLCRLEELADVDEDVRWDTLQSWLPKRDWLRPLLCLE